MMRCIISPQQKEWQYRRRRRRWPTATLVPAIHLICDVITFYSRIRRDEIMNQTAIVLHDDHSAVLELQYQQCDAMPHHNWPRQDTTDNNDIDIDNQHVTPTTIRDTMAAEPTQLSSTSNGALHLWYFDNSLYMVQPSSFTWLLSGAIIPNESSTSLNEPCP
jgi:hypothetical protein